MIITPIVHIGKLSQPDPDIAVGGRPARKDPGPPHVEARGHQGHSPWHRPLREAGLLCLLRGKRLRLRWSPASPTAPQPSEWTRQVLRLQSPSSFHSTSPPAARSRPGHLSPCDHAGVQPSEPLRAPGHLQRAWPDLVPSFQLGHLGQTLGFLGFRVPLSSQHSHGSERT